MAQQAAAQKITLAVKNEKLSNVLQSIGEQSGYRFFYNSELVKNSDPVTINLSNASLKESLDAITNGRQLSYTIEDRAITIKAAQAPKVAQTAQGHVHGTVTDEQNQPLGGVSVHVKGKSQGTQTDVKGNFTIAAPIGATLTFSSIGYKPKEAKVTENKALRIFLSPDANTINEVVVTGVFERPKNSFTGAVTTVTAEDLKRFAPQNPLMALQILDPSFQMPPNLEAGGNPNVMPEVRLRGQNNFALQEGRTNATLDALYGNNPNAPLFIMDGFEIPLQTLVDMDMNRIASISLLKDASATAIYGSRGANGVVVIETVRPKPGQIQVGYTGNAGLVIPDLSSYNLMNAREKYDFETLLGLHTITARGDNMSHNMRNVEILNGIYRDVVRGVDTYWLSQPLQTAISQSHTINVMGGDEAFRYTLTGNYRTNPGVMKGNLRTSFNTAANLQYVTKKINIGNNTQYFNVRGQESPYGSFSLYTEMNPFLAPYDENGNLLRFVGDFQNTWGDGRGDPFRRNASLYRQENPLYAASLNPEAFNLESRLINNSQIRWNILKNLFVQGRFSYTLVHNERHNFQPAGLPRFDEFDFDRRGRYALNQGRTNLWDGDVQVNLAQSFGKHMLFATTSGSMRNMESISYSQTAVGFANENMRNFIFGTQYNPGSSPSGSQSTARLVTLRGNVNYGYNERYFMDFSYSLDGSSQFGANRRYNTFWSLGGRWNLEREAFLRESTLVNRLQLRGSIGPTGGQNFPPYQGITTYGYATGTPYRGLIPIRLLNYGDPDLQWQQTFKQNLGVDITLFQERLNITADVFQDRVSNVLMPVLRPPSVGFSEYSTNLGKMQNTGWEFNANVTVLRNLQRRINWNVGFNGMQLRNKILEIAAIPGVTLPTTNDPDNPLTRTQELQLRNNFRYVVGGSMDDVWATPSAGIDPATGREIFIMPDGSYTYNASRAFERPLGSVQPKLLGGINTSFQYKDWVLSAAANYRTGARIYNVNLRERLEFVNNLNFYRNLDRRVATERWQREGDVSPFLGLTSRPFYRESDRFLQTEHLLQVQSISLAYRFNKENAWMKRARLSNTLVSLFWNTPFVFTSLESEQRGLNTPFQRHFSIQLSTTLF
ncbi:SusC/RagA family TonB-linked outer membrane protein [Sphingobacterium griseoflavum]|uniref:SusC/RagA family TonB-linked outer membrane protein n=1 Tax=Sphingobacterium griseoflavum TaxID=1474952 RepID=A0ABQ3HUM2_9SPHI|nr:SusC/RagA family TonB-linked outer membrane protein [Sphingobacterium griseoflavum]GHE29895.1 SusC/RagA family TonB-linked outer membrane protein [Sphingobacterium griseoflavum]